MELTSFDYLLSIIGLIGIARVSIKTAHKEYVNKRHYSFFFNLLGAFAMVFCMVKFVSAIVR